MAQEVRAFLGRYIGPQSPQDAQYHILAACAIIAETTRVSTVDGRAQTGSGVKVENVMRHLGELSKERFLEILEAQLRKAESSQHYLAEKVIHIKIAFRVFKKFKAIFGHLAQRTKPRIAHLEQLEALFWIVYLIVQHRLGALENLSLRTIILTTLLEEAFCRYYGQLSLKAVRQLISDQNNFPELPAISEQQSAAIREIVFQELSSAFQNRDASANLNHCPLPTQLPLLTRLVDDLSSKYERLYQALPEGKFIDEITFLELTRNLTPQAFPSPRVTEPISQVLKFDDDDEDDTPEEMPPTAIKNPNY
jgi:hypothetical protein